MHATQRLSAKYNGIIRDLEWAGTALHQCLKKGLVLNEDIPPYTSGTQPQKQTIGTGTEPQVFSDQP